MARLVHRDGAKEEEEEQEGVMKEEGWNNIYQACNDAKAMTQ